MLWLQLRSDCDALFDFLHISQANEFGAGCAAAVAVGGKQVCVVQSFDLFVVVVAVAALVSAFLFTLTFICELFVVFCCRRQCYYYCFLQAIYKLLRNFMPTATAAAAELAAEAAAQAATTFLVGGRVK